MLEVLIKVFRFIWPPHHTKSDAEELHSWRQSISMSVTALIIVTVIHIGAASGGLVSLHPGYASNEDAERWERSRARDLRIAILELHVKYCTSYGALAISYNRNMNSLLAEYRELGGNGVELPECEIVREVGATDEI